MQYKKVTAFIIIIIIFTEAWQVVQWPFWWWKHFVTVGGVPNANAITVAEACMSAEFINLHLLLAGGKREEVKE